MRRKLQAGVFGASSNHQGGAHVLMGDVVRWPPNTGPPQVAQFCAWYKRLEQGTLELPITDSDKPHMTIDSVELAMWTAGISLKSAKTRRKRMKVA